MLFYAIGCHSGTFVIKIKKKKTELGGYQVLGFYDNNCNEYCLLGCENYQLCIEVCCVCLHLIP